MTGQEAFHFPGVIQSVVECQTNGPLIAVAAQLWMRPEDVVVDVTYGRGLFWTHHRPDHLVAHDLALDGVDFRQLPEADGTVDVVVFDPPYIPQGGRETSTIRERAGIRSDGFLERYGLLDGPRSVAELEKLIAGGINEAARVLRPRGRLLAKCADYICGGKFISGRHFVVETAADVGLVQVDELIHYSGLGPQPRVNLDGSPRQQVHSRRAHSFLLIFEKPGRRLPKGAP